MPAALARQMKVSGFKANVIERDVALQNDAQLVIIMTMPIQ